MIFDKSLRIIWGIIFVVCLANILIFNNDSTVRSLFAILTGALFIIDFIRLNKAIYGKITRQVLKIRKWHIFADFTQWVFWVMLLYIPFRAELSIWYKLFLLTDLFFVSTFAFYKFTKQKQ